MLLGQVMQVDITWTIKAGGCYSGKSGGMTNLVDVCGAALQIPGWAGKF